MGGMTGNALLSLAIRPNTEADRKRLARGVRTLMAEDPTMSVNADPTTGDVVIAGMGELHLEIILDRLKREFSLWRRASAVRSVAYKETLTLPRPTAKVALRGRADGRGPKDTPTRRSIYSRASQAPATCSKTRSSKG